MIKEIHFNIRLRMFFPRGEGFIIGCIIFVCSQVNGPITGSAYYAPSPTPLFLDQTEARWGPKKFLVLGSS